MTTSSRVVGLLVGLVTLPMLISCTGDTSSSDAGPGGTTSATPSASTSSTPVPTPSKAVAAPKPARGACYAYPYSVAVSPVNPQTPVPCPQKHTARTFAVGDLDTLVAGHLISVDSDRVQAQVASACPEAFGRFVGGSVEARRLSMLRPVWFTPSLEQSDDGANWYRCDVVALAEDERLAPLVGRLRGILDRPEAAAHYGMCGTAEPGTPAFRRVICSSQHTWRALSTVDLPGRRYPGVEKVRSAGQQPCTDAANEVADDPLHFRWGYEWPTREQWAAGQHYGLCWGETNSSE